MSLCGTERNAYISAIVLIESLVWRGSSVITLACRSSLLLFMLHCGCKTIYGYGDRYRRTAISPSADGVRATTSFLSLFLWKWDILKTKHLHRDQFNQRPWAVRRRGERVAFCLFYHCLIRKNMIVMFTSPAYSAVHSNNLQSRYPEGWCRLKMSNLFFSAAWMRRCDTDNSGSFSMMFSGQTPAATLSSIHTRKYRNSWERLVKGGIWKWPEVMSGPLPCNPLLLGWKGYDKTHSLILIKIELQSTSVRPNPACTTCATTSNILTVVLSHSHMWLVKAG